MATVHGTRIGRTIVLAALGVSLSGLVHLVAAPPAAAAESSATILMSAQVGPRARVEPDRSVVHLEPGQSVTMTVAVKVRMAAGSVAAVTLHTSPIDADRAPVTYEFSGATGPLTSQTTLGAVSRSGVHSLPLTLTLAPTARRAVTLPLAFTVSAGGPPLRGVAVPTHVTP